MTLWQVKKEIRCAQVNCEREFECSSGFRAVGHLHRPLELQHLTAVDLLRKESSVVAVGVPRREDHCGQSILAASKPKGTVTRGEDVALPRRRLVQFKAGDAQWLQISFVGEEDTGVLCSERVPRIWRDGESQHSEALARKPDVGHRQHNVVQRMCFAHGKLPGDLRRCAPGKRTMQPLLRIHSKATQKLNKLQASFTKI